MAIPLGAGGGGSLPVNIVLTSSQTWVPPVDGNICIHVVGAGGGGASNNANAAGAGAGGYCKKTSLAVTTSGSFTVVVGSGGQGGQGSSNSGQGSNGGNSTVAGTGLSSTLTANGGTGGQQYNAGAGGTAANGNVNNTGGAGNNHGGGAVGLTGTGNSGGNGDNQRGFRGGDCDLIGPESHIGYGYIFGGRGGMAFLSQTNSSSSYGVFNYGPTGRGEFLAGGGKHLVSASGSSWNNTGGDGGIGGGGGGCINAISAGNAHGGNGGDGIVIIQYLPA